MANTTIGRPTGATIRRGSPPQQMQQPEIEPLTYQPQQPQIQRPIMRNTVPTPGTNMGYSQSPPPPPPVQQPKRTRTVFIDRTTKNKSFLDISNYLKAIGIKNNSFMLTIVDPDLIGVNPHDANLSPFYKQKVLRECMVNYWYYLREVVRINDQGGTAVPFKLTRGNLAVNFCMALNLNIFQELPRLTSVRRHNMIADNYI